MVINKHSFSYFLILLILLSGCEYKGKYETFIENIGNWSGPQKISITIFKDNNGLLNIRHTRSNGDFAVWDSGFMNPNSDWFVFVETSRRFWLFYGGNLYVIYEEKLSSGSGLVAKIQGNQFKRTYFKSDLNIPDIVKERIEGGTQDVL